MLIVTELFNIAVNGFDAKKSRYKRVLVVTELVVSGTKCNTHGQGINITKADRISTVNFIAHSTHLSANLVSKVHCVFAAEIATVKPHVLHMTQFVEHIAGDDDASDGVIAASCGLIGYETPFNQASTSTQSTLR